jgi:hypothetical protein
VWLALSGVELPESPGVRDSERGSSGVLVLFAARDVMELARESPVGCGAHWFVTKRGERVLVGPLADAERERLIRA